MFTMAGWWSRWPTDIHCCNYGNDLLNSNLNQLFTHLGSSKMGKISCSVTEKKSAAPTHHKMSIFFVLPLNCFSFSLRTNTNLLRILIRVFMQAVDLWEWPQWNHIQRQNKDKVCISDSLHIFLRVIFTRCRYSWQQKSRNLNYFF